MTFHLSTPVKASYRWLPANRAGGGRPAREPQILTKTKTMAFSEFKLEPVRLGYNPLNGQFLKGHIPANKGKKWSEFMSRRGQRNAARGWVNLDKYRPKTRPDNAGRCGKPVIAVNDKGEWLYFQHIGAAGAYINGNRENVRRCCQENERARSRSGRASNSDHKYKGIRFYFESDTKWTTKISR